MSESRANDVDAAVVLIRQAMEKVIGLADTPDQRIAANSIETVLDDVIRRIEALSDDTAG